MDKPYPESVLHSIQIGLLTEEEVATMPLSWLEMLAQGRVFRLQKTRARSTSLGFRVGRLLGALLTLALGVTLIALAAVGVWHLIASHL